MGGNNLSLTRRPVIIIGAGIGGLTAAAYLSKLEIPSLLLEQTSCIGGRCSTRTINGNRFEVGAIYVGGGAFDRLGRAFGVNCQTFPIRCGVRVGEHIVPFPFGWKTLLEFKACGVPYLETLRFFYRCRMLSDPMIFERYESVGQIIDKLTSNRLLRQFLNAMFGVSGTSPYRLPSRYLYKGNPAVSYRTANPEALPEGNGGIASILFDLATENGKALFNVKVKKILVKNGRAVGVQTNQGEYFGKAVVSNAGLRATVLHLTDPVHWRPDYYEQVKKMRETLKVVNIFLTFSRSFELPSNFSVFLVPCDDLIKEFQILESGSFSTQSMYILHVPSNLESNSKDDHRATLQFYYPRGQITAQLLNDQVNRIMHDGLERLFRGFSKAITSYIVYDPKHYQAQFGFPPSVFGVSPDLNYKRLPIESPITNLYCVGDSVAPELPCVPQAMQSGLDCARMIAAKLGIGFQSG